MKEKIMLNQYNPDLATQWHPTKNGNLTPDQVTYGSNKKVWWVCPTCGHEWQAVINNRTRGRGCPVCAGKVVVHGVNDLATSKPELVAQWHPTKNGDLTPSQVTVGSEKKVWWICQCGHEWEAIVNTRAKGIGCPYCMKEKMQRPTKGVNDLSTRNPRLAAEWHPAKNGTLTPDQVAYASNKKAWWLCPSCGHEWQAMIVSRYFGVGCPQCVIQKKHDSNKTSPI